MLRAWCLVLIAYCLLHLLSHYHFCYYVTHRFNTDQVFVNGLKIVVAELFNRLPRHYALLYSSSSSHARNELLHSPAIHLAGWIRSKVGSYNEDTGLLCYRRCSSSSTKQRPDRLAS